MNPTDQWHYLVVEGAEGAEKESTLYHPEGCPVIVWSGGVARQEFDCATAQSIREAGYYGMFDESKDALKEGVWRVRPWVERITGPDWTEYDGGWEVEPAAADSATDTERPRPKIGPDGSITNLDELPRPEPQEYHWCKGCGHEFRVHYLGGKCHGIKLMFSAEQGDETPCKCERFEPRSESVPDAGTEISSSDLCSCLHARGSHKGAWGVCWVVDCPCRAFKQRSGAVSTDVSDEGAGREEPRPEGRASRGGQPPASPSSGHVVCPVCKGDGAGPPVGADGCGRCGGEGEVPASAYPTDELRTSGGASQRRQESVQLSGYPTDAAVKVWKEWRELLRADYRRCPEGDWYTEALEVADGFMRQMMEAVESVPTATTEGKRWATPDFEKAIYDEMEKSFAEWADDFGDDTISEHSQRVARIAARAARKVLGLSSDLSWDSATDDRMKLWKDGGAYHLEGRFKHRERRLAVILATIWQEYEGEDFKWEQAVADLIAALAQLNADNANAQKAADSNGDADDG